MALIKLLDISGIFHPVWHIQSARGDVGSAASEAVRILRARAADGGADYVVACCDTGRSFRHEIAQQFKARNPEYKGYKGNRPEKDAALFAALDRVIDNLEQDGVPIMRAEGFEADDVIATLTKWAVENGHDVEIVSEDKDLCALIIDPDPEQNGAPSVVVVRKDGERVNAEGCIKRLGVPPDRVPHMLALVGDDSDNIPGSQGNAKVNAARILWGWTDKEGWKRSPFKTFDDVVSAAVEDQADLEASLREIDIARRHKDVHALAKKRTPDAEIARALSLTLEQVAALKAEPPPARLPEPYKPRFSEAVRKGLITQAENYDLGLQLTTLRFDVPLDFAAVTAPRVPKPRTKPEWFERGKDAQKTKHETTASDNEEPIEEQKNVNEPAVITQPAEPVESGGQGVIEPGVEPIHSVAISRAKAENNIIRLARYALEPRNYDEARIAAADAADSGQYKDIATPAQALQVILTGRKYGLTVAESLRMIHIIEGKPSLSAQLIIGLVLSSGYAEYFEFTEATPTSATWETLRKGSRRGPKTWTFTIEHAKKARLGGIYDKRNDRMRDDFDPNSNWAKHPGPMCLWRAGVFLARFVYTDLVGGLYMPDELGGREPELDATHPIQGLVVT